MKRHSFKSLVLSTLAAATTIATPLTFGNAALANPIEDPDRVGWVSIRGYSSDQFHQYFNRQKAAGYRVIDLEVDETDRQTTYSAIFQVNSDQRGWASLRDLSHGEFSQKWNEFKDKGYRLIDQEAYERNNQRYYAGVWVENKENLSWLSYRDVTSDRFGERFETYNEQGYRMIDVEAYPTNQGLRYAAVWVKDTDNLGWVEHRDMSSTAFADKFKAYNNQGFRLLDIESYQQDNQQKFAGIWAKNTNGRGWKSKRGMTAQSYSNQWKTYKDAGYRLVDFEVYPTENGSRYAGIWRQNSDRVSWAAKDEVNQTIKAYRKQFKIPGVSVAIRHQGKLVYARGFGHADIEQDKVAHAGTVYRLASISKSVTRALTLRLVDLGALSLDEATRDYVPGLPEFHRHTIRELMTHRSGIRHYKNTDYQKACKLTVSNKANWQDGSSTQYPTAGAATALFLEDPLLFEPGDQKCYSTHAYTVLGAALEGATNLSYSQLVERELTQGLGLSTLRPENRNQANADRATLYKGNEAATPDNISWKYPGGGLEASSVDLALFGQAIIDGTFLSPESQAETSFSHSGKQLGAESHLEINENAELSIAVLSNQRAGANPEKLAKALAKIVLNSQ
ncbi:MAG: serine hydrolase [Cyanobacteria bacterium J06634_5]